MNTTFAAVFFAALAICGCHASLQRVAVKGVLFCGNKPASGVDVKLVDKDKISDDVLDKQKTDKNGAFELDGSTSETFSIDPVLKIYHDCDDGLIPCQRRWKIKVPKRYIGKSSSRKPEVWNLGTVNLEARINEDRNCI